MRGVLPVGEPRPEQRDPPGARGAGGAMNQTFQNSAQVLSIGVFFTLIVIGLAASLPSTMSAGLEAHGVSAATAQQASQLPPISILFAAFLGYNPIEHLLGAHALAGLSAHQHAVLTGNRSSPLISALRPSPPLHLAASSPRARTAAPEPDAPTAAGARRRGRGPFLDGHPPRRPEDLGRAG